MSPDHLHIRSNPTGLVNSADGSDDAELVAGRAAVFIMALSRAYLAAVKASVCCVISSAPGTRAAKSGGALFSMRSRVVGTHHHLTAHLPVAFAAPHWTTNPSMPSAVQALLYDALKGNFLVPVLVPFIPKTVYP
ncbi:MAG TPA: hypothetical protein VIY07_07825 [Pseudolabrys sp.]